jgi:hypothetical protein
MVTWTVMMDSKSIITIQVTISNTHSAKGDGFVETRNSLPRSILKKNANGPMFLLLMTIAKLNPCELRT